MDPATPDPGAAPTARRAARGRAGLAVSVAALLVLGGLYLWHSLVWIPRGGFTVHSDPDAAGWASALAARARGGEPLHSRSLTAFPPGGVALMALVQRLTGRVALTDELWAVAVLRLVLAGVAAWMGAAVRGRSAAVVVGTGALLVSVGVSAGGVELWAGAVLAWASLATLLHAWGGGGLARRALVLSGALGALALSFDQALGAAALVGAALALLLVPGAGRARALAPLAAGAGVGLLALPLLGWSVGGALGPTLREVLWGPLRDGGTVAAQLQALLLQVFQRGVLLGSLLNLALLAWLVVRAARAPGGLGPAALVARPGLLGRAGAPALALGSLVVMGLGIAAAHREAALVSPWLGLARGHLELLPGLGLAVGGVVLLARDPEALAPGAQAGGQRFRALLVATLAGVPVLGMAFRVTDAQLAFSPVLPVSLLAFLLVGAPAGARWLGPVIVLAGGLATAIGLAQRVPLRVRVEQGFWQGQLVGVRGEELLQAAARVRELAGPSGTVLVVPGDLALEALIARPRPPLRGAVAFASSYPAWAVDEDLARLRIEPPQVIVVHPAQARDWERLFGDRHRDGGAARLTRGVVGELLPAAYRRDRAYRTVYRWGQGSLEVWVRR